MGELQARRDAPEGQAIRCRRGARVPAPASAPGAAPPAPRPAFYPAFPNGLGLYLPPFHPKMRDRGVSDSAAAGREAPWRPTSAPPQAPTLPRAGSLARRPKPACSEGPSGPTRSTLPARCRSRPPSAPRQAIHPALPNGLNTFRPLFRPKPRSRMVRALARVGHGRLRGAGLGHRPPALGPCHGAGRLLAPRPEPAVRCPVLAPTPSVLSRVSERFGPVFVPISSETA